MEKWLPICGYEGLYEISSNGKVASLNYRGNGYRKELTPKKNNCGYLWIELCNGKEKKQELIHRLVAKHFLNVGVGDNIYVNHKDEDKTNNDVSNLEWCSNAYNNEYSKTKHPEKTISGGKKWDFKPSEKYRKHCEKLIKKDLNGVLVEECGLLSEYAKSHGLNMWSIIQVCDGKRKTAYGYKWEFLPPV